MNPVAKRTVSALVCAAAVVAGLFFLPAGVVTAAAVVLAVLAHTEMVALVAKRCEIMAVPSVIVSAAFLSVCAATGSNSLPAVVSLFAIGAFAIAYKGENAIRAFAGTALSFMAVPFMLSYFVMYPGEFGVKWLFYIIAITKVSDMGGFAFGVAFGRHKMCPSVSPNKSWEGMAGSLFASSLISCAFIPMTHFTVLKAVVFGLVAATVGTVGDLVESRVKRDAGVKDSSSFLPSGMGGLLDTFDSLVYVPAVLWHFI